MTDLEKLLQDPRSHRAVPETEMVQRVKQSAMDQWQAEQAQAKPKRSAARKEEIRAQLQGVRSRRRIGVGHVLGVALSLAALLVLISPHVASMPRLDLVLKYNLYELVDTTALGMLYNPLQTSILLALAGAALGFAISAQARAAVRRMF